jgi:hypothetical protein
MCCVAIASRSVDVPDPFSPTKKVTGVCSSIISSVRTTGTSNGKPAGIEPRRLRETERSDNEGKRQ